MTACIENSTEIVTKSRYAPAWKVLLHNDDTTPMDYVVLVMMDAFFKNIEEAARLVLEAHNSGVAMCYSGTREACELKLELGKSMNEVSGFKLSVSMESYEV